MVTLCSHGLSYRNIELRQSHGSISHELTEVFGYSFSFDIAARLKSIAARYYDTTYRELSDAPQGRQADSR